MDRCQHAKAVADLLEQNAAEDYLNDLEEFWECWLTNDENQNMPKQEVKAKLFRVKSVREFLKKLVDLKQLSCIM